MLVSGIQHPRNEQTNETDICVVAFFSNLKPEVTRSQFPQLSVMAVTQPQYHGGVCRGEPGCFLQCRESKESREKEDKQLPAS